MYPLFPPSLIPHPIGYGDATCQTTILRSTTWVPTSIAGCVLWLPPVAGFSGYMYTNAAGISEVTSDGQVLGRWEDASLTGNAATQTTAGDKGIYKTGIQNGLPMILFDGVSDHLRMDSVANYVTGTDAAATFAIVVKKVGNTGADSFYSFANGAGGGKYLRMYSSGTTIVHEKRDDAGVTASQTDSVDLACHLYIVRYNGTTLDVWKDNVQTISGAAFDVGVTTLNRGALAAYVELGVADFLEGYIGEVIAWNNAISNANVTAARTALIAKWGL